MSEEVEKTAEQNQQGGAEQDHISKMDRLRARLKVFQQLKGADRVTNRMLPIIQENKSLLTSKELNMLDFCIKDFHYENAQKSDSEPDMDRLGKLDYVLDGWIQSTEFAVSEYAFNTGCSHIKKKFTDKYTEKQWLGQNKIYDGKTFRIGNEQKFSRALYGCYNPKTNSAIVRLWGDNDSIEDTVEEATYVDRGRCAFGSWKTEIDKVQVKLNEDGVIDFSLPENKEILKYKNVVGELISIYPESLKTLPNVFFAANPKLFVSKFGEGVKGNFRDERILGTMTKEEYLNTRTDELQEKVAAIEKEFAHDSPEKEAALNALKDYNAQMGRGE